jgi:hypothetical protein
MWLGFRFNVGVEFKHAATVILVHLDCQDVTANPWGTALELIVDTAKAVEGFARLFGPGTLLRTWGTRPAPLAVVGGSG